MTLESNNVQYAYLYFLALDSIGQTKMALDKLKSDIFRYQNNQQLKELGINFAKKSQDKNAFHFFVNLP